MESQSGDRFKPLAVKTDKARTHKHNKILFSRLQNARVTHNLFPRYRERTIWTWMAVRVETPVTMVSPADRSETPSDRKRQGHVASPRVEVSGVCGGFVCLQILFIESQGPEQSAVILQDLYVESLSRLGLIPACRQDSQLVLTTQPDKTVMISIT
ncbi:hypothetical protein EYF80_037146 [Liparis tanakae]|uniref:Uncharacterized protein n=1 Tax=Liparis tanakae TaxID=230148 RepID=A0A4Z2GGN2_9TELE|nr:hypothetical protein EYF80_037146 [Liparis tanakae]